MVRWFLAAVAVALVVPSVALAGPLPDPHGPLWPWRGGAYLPAPTVCRGSESGRTVCSVPGGDGIRHRDPPRVLAGRVFAPGDRARIRAAVRRRARESGWRRVGRVEILSASSTGGLSSANLLVWARKDGAGQCEAVAWWTPGFEPVIRSKDVLLEGTGSCVPVEDPR